MQNIEINTTQNVHISYEVAHLGDRIIAFFIDFLLIMGGFIISSIFSGIISGSGNGVIFYLIGLPIFFFYNLVSEISMNGQTIGKRSMNLKVVKTNGKEPKNSDFFLRWVFRMIDIYFSMGTISVIFIATSKNGQRLGDLVSDTTIIRIKPGSHISYDDIERNQNLADYSVQFPLVKNLSDQDIITIQEALGRSRKFPNPAHLSLLNELVELVKEKIHMDVNEMVDNKEDFLTTTIKDYIALTR